MKTLAAGVRPANPGASASFSQLELRRIRSALVVRIDAAAEKAKWGCNPESEGMPSRLFAAGCYLAANGFDDQPCDGERWFNTDFTYYRSFVSGCTEVVEDGRKAIYQGSRAIAPFQTLQVAA
jgi:hypothetical protein